MLGKTLIAYASKSGANAWAAGVIAATLKSTYDADVTVADLKDGEPNIAPYQNIIVGSGVRGGRLYGDAVQFLGKDFGDRKVALYFGCGSGGDPRQHDKTIEEYSKKALVKNQSLKPIDACAFGGCLKILGRTVFDSRKEEDVREWAVILGKKFDAADQAK